MEKFSGSIGTSFGDVQGVPGPPVPGGVPAAVSWIGLETQVAWQEPPSLQRAQIT